MPGVSMSHRIASNVRSALYTNFNASAALGGTGDAAAGKAQ